MLHICIWIYAYPEAHASKVEDQEIEGYQIEEHLARQTKSHLKQSLYLAHFQES